MRPVLFLTYRLCLASEAERHLTLRLAAEEEDRLDRLALSNHHWGNVMAKEQRAEKQREGKKKKRLNKKMYFRELGTLHLKLAKLQLRNDLNTPLCPSELVSESPKEGNRPHEILKQVQDDTTSCVLRSFLSLSGQTL